MSEKRALAKFIAAELLGVNITAHQRWARRPAPARPGGLAGFLPRPAKVAGPGGAKDVRARAWGMGLGARPGGWA